MEEAVSRVLAASGLNDEDASPRTPQTPQRTRLA